mmetsp:Transcript_7361/g.20134  ORF Transcript_7361/g.20134 Transcript_7361/m.20134 type:complete len:91 (+) Transcript_7361:33-305(+)
MVSARMEKRMLTAVGYIRSQRVQTLLEDDCLPTFCAPTSPLPTVYENDFQTREKNAEQCCPDSSLMEPTAMGSASVDRVVRARPRQLVSL